MLLELLKKAASTVAQPSASECKSFDSREKGLRSVHSVKTFTIAGPNTGTWSATVVVGSTPDGKGWRPTTKTYTISNSTPAVDDALDIAADNWGAWITAYSGDANVLGSNGWQGINAMVEA